MLPRTNSDAAVTVLHSSFCWIFLSVSCIVELKKKTTHTKCAASVRGWFWPLQHGADPQQQHLSLFDSEGRRRSEKSLIHTRLCAGIWSNRLVFLNLCLSALHQLDWQSCKCWFFSWLCIYFFACACAEFETAGLPCRVSSVFLRSLHALVVCVRSRLCYFWSCLVVRWGTSHDLLWHHTYFIRSSTDSYLFTFDQIPYSPTIIDTTLTTHCSVLIIVISSVRSFPLRHIKEVSIVEGLRV